MDTQAGVISCHCEHGWAGIYMLGYGALSVCISYLSVAEMKYHEQGNLPTKEELGLQSRGRRVHHGGEV